MKKMLLAVLLFAVSLFPAGAQATHTVYNVNTSFETDNNSDGIPDGWGSMASPFVLDPDDEISTDYARTGSKSFKFIFGEDDFGYDSDERGLGSTCNTCSGSQGDTWRFTAWTLHNPGEATAQAAIAIRVIKTGLPFQQQVEILYIPGPSSEWEESYVEVVAPWAYSAVAVAVIHDYSDNPIYFDDGVLTKVH